MVREDGILYVDPEYHGKVLDRIDALDAGNTVRLRALGICMTLLFKIDYSTGYVGRYGNVKADDVYKTLGKTKRTMDKYLSLLKQADAIKIIDGYIMINPSWYWCENQVKFKKKYMWAV